MDGDGKEVAKFSGYMDGPKFIEKVTANLDPEQSPERIRARFEAGERTPKVVNSYAMQLMEQRKEDEGFKVIDDYFASLSEADRLKAENEFIFTVYTIDLDNDRARFMISHKTNSQVRQPARSTPCLQASTDANSVHISLATCIVKAATRPKSSPSSKRDSRSRI